MLSDANSAHTERWALGLVSKGHRVLLYSLSAPRNPFIANIPGVDFETLNLPTSTTYDSIGAYKKLVYVRAVPEVRKLMKKVSADLAHAHYASSYGVVATLGMLRPRVVSIWGADVYSSPYVSRFHKYVIAKVLRSADAVHSTSWAMREQGLRLCARKIDVVPFGIDTDRFNPRGSDYVSKDYITIGLVKSLEEKYGIHVLLKAFAAIRLAGAPAMKLLIVGGGTMEQRLKSLASELGVADSTTFTGPVPYDAVPDYQRMMDIAVFPSIDDSESFGVSVIEAQSCGRPVIVSRIGGLPEVVEAGKSALIVEPGNPEKLATAILELARNPAEMAAFGQRGRSNVIQKYQMSKCLDLLIAHYDALTPSRC